MDLRTLGQLFSLRDLRNAVVGLLVVAGGLGLAGLTYYAHITGRPRMAGIAAAISLVFVLLILIFVVPPLARNASREASQLNLPFEITAGGAVMLGLVMIVSFSAWNTGNNLLFLILSFLAGALIAGFIAGSITLKKLDVSLRFPEAVSAGEETPILVSIHNRKLLLPSYSVAAEIRGREREGSIVLEDLERLLPRWLAKRLARPALTRRFLTYFAFLPRKEVTENRAVHVFRDRGMFIIKDFELSTRFPFGFFRHRRRLAARETELIILPQTEPAGDIEVSAPAEMGRMPGVRRGHGQDLLALREYQPFDDLRRVDWKATARSRHLIVREFAAEDEVRVTLILDNVMPPEAETGLSLRDRIRIEQSGGPFVRSERFENGITKAASLLAFYSEQNAEVRLVMGSESGDFGRGPRHLYDCLKRLALADPVFAEKADSLEIDHVTGINILVTAWKERETAGDAAVVYF